jgi:hypothetical protein
MLTRKVRHVAAEIGREEKIVVEQKHIRFDVEKTEWQLAVADRFEEQRHGRV